MSELAPPASLDDYRVWLNEPEKTGAHKHLFSVRAYYSMLPIKGKVLEFGGYVGAVARHYAKQGCEVTSIEGAEEFCDEFEKNTAGLGIKLIRSLIEDFQPTEQYDTVVCTEILNHVVDPVAVCRKGGDCLREGGQMCVTVPHRPVRVERKHITLGELRDIMRQAGFENRDVYVWDNGKNMPQNIVRGVK